MKRERFIAGTPVRSGFDSWVALVDVIVASLENSSNIPVGSVAPELARIDGLGPALAGGGYLDNDAIVLVADPLHVSFTIVTGGPAFEVEDSESVIPGSGTADAAWQVYIPRVATFAADLEAAVKDSAHLKVGSAPKPREESAKSAGALDLESMRNPGGQS